ncbi:hypothetical protein BIU88_06325 [Chlorobaculum limnaeum]|uniref:Uncharacterized protein n=1 Tax=Chlorobaculum limnaeum TaxID=274537 RepID=A0A1D8CXZ8_CHLLM|nr:hypothetical protein [Chlorobaculum limnaeum]AOS83800.1 hypothetical protein BIU88_06325 [Chlorobaculum limnaeum]
MIEQITIRRAGFMTLKNHLRTRTIFVTMKRIKGSPGARRHALPGILPNFSETLDGPFKAIRPRTST